MLDRIFITYLFLQPVFNKILQQSGNVFLSYIDELFIALFATVFLIKTMKRGVIKSKYLYIFLPTVYLTFIWFYNSLPVYNVLQIFLYLQIFIIYIYFNSYNDIQKHRKFFFFCKVARITFYVSLFFVVVNLVDPGFVKKLLGLPLLDDRGFDGLTVVSFFGTRTGYSQFLIVFIILLILNISIEKRTRDLFLVLSLFLMLVTFSRKEVLIGCLILGAYLWKENDSILVKFTLPVLTGGMLIYYYMSYFEEANTSAFKESYVRWRIMEYSIEIIKDYFPFGSGPGTFGSQISTSYQEIYNLYNVPEAITGTSTDRGPIYDSFLFSFIAEIGIGIFLYVGFYFKIYSNKLISLFKEKRYLKSILMASIILLAIFSPIIMTPVGMLLIIIFALINV